MHNMSAGTEPDNDGDYTDVVNSRFFKRKATVSYACIVHTLVDGEIKYLVGRVRDTIPFKEFVRCTLSGREIPYYCQFMSQEEKYRLLTEPFQDLVDDVIVNHSTRAYKAACEVGEQFALNCSRHQKILSDPSVGLHEAPWIFPKGRMQENETEVECALREFEEETHIVKEAIRVYDTSPLEETYFGLDKNLYKTVYFVGFLEYAKFQAMTDNIRREFTVTPYRVSLSEEIAKVKWLDYGQAVEKLDNPKAYILRITHTFLTFHLKRDPPKRRHSL